MIERGDLIRDLDATLRRRAGRDQINPTAQMREAVDRDAGPFVCPRPAPIGDVGDRILSGEIFMILQARIEDAEEPPDLVLIAIDGRLDLLGEIAIRVGAV
jgi:hypothetical protein